MISKHIFNSDVISGNKLWIDDIRSTGDTVLVDDNLKVHQNVDVSGSVFILKDLTVKGTTTTLDTVTVTVDDHNIELGAIPNPTDITAQGGGLTLKGDTDKTFNWGPDYNKSWQSSENLGVAPHKYIFTEKVRARDTDGLFLEDDGGNGIFVRDGGNVGIGTVNPAEKLRVEESNSGVHLIARFQDTSDSDLVKGIRINKRNKQSTQTTFFDLSVDAEENKIGIGLGNNSTELANGKEDLSNSKIVIDSLGKVGIGTINPSAKTTIEGKGSDSPMQASGLFDIKSTENSKLADIRLEAKDSGGVTRAGGLGFNADNNVTYLANGGAQVLNIDNNQRVGIGTVAPKRTLEVQSDVNETVFRGIAPDKKAILDIVKTNQGDTKFNNTFYSNGVAGDFIFSNGNVGINASNPGAKLDINGDIKFNGDILPYASETFDIGSSSKKIRDIYLSASSLHIGNQDISVDAEETLLLPSGVRIGYADGPKLSTNGTSIAISSQVSLLDDLSVAGNLTVNGTVSTINSTTVSVDDKNIELGSVNSPTNDTANGGGITLKGATDKKISWSKGTASWDFSEHIGIADGKYLFTDKVRARDSAGLLLQDDNGNGISISDGGDTSLSDALSVAEATTLSKTLSVGGAATLSNSLSVAEGTTLSKTLSVGGAATLSNSLSVAEGTTLSKTLSVGGAATLSNSLSVAEGTTLSKTLSVGGAATLSNSLSVAEGTTLSKTLSVGGIVTLSQNSAPSTTTNKLYNSSGNLFWDGVDVINNYSSISSLTDTTISSPAKGHLLVYDANNTKWVNSTLTAGSNITISNNNGGISIASAYPSTATSSTLGLVKIGYTENGKNYPVELNSGKMYVNVPWVDTNTTYSTATSSTLGLVKIGYTENGKNYPVELNSGKMYVNVPWTDTNTQRTDTEIRTAVGGSFPSFSASNNGQVLKVINGVLSWAVDEEGSPTSAGGASTQIQYNNNGNFAGSANLTFDGTNLSCKGDVTAYASSDERLKNNISNISSSIEKIKQINGVNFQWSDKQSTYSGKDVGVIAQEVQKVLPEVVTERGDGYLAVKYEKIIPLLIEAIKDQQKEIEILKSKIKINLTL